MPTELTLIGLSRALASHAATRQGLVAENIAQADTPGYRPKDLAPFAALMDEGQEALRRTRAAHGAFEGPQRAPVRIDTATPVAPNGNGVSLDTEMLRLAEIRQQHDLALTVYRSTLGILRGALGRGA